jgi:putative heme-binding domain-containing protein
VLAKLAAAGRLSDLQAKIAALVEQSFKRAADSRLSPSQRVAAIESLSLASAQQALPVLGKLISNREPQAVQRAAIVAMGRYRQPGVAQSLISAWNQLSPQLRETANDVLFARAERALAMLDAVDRGELSDSDLAPTRLQTAARSKNAELAKRAKMHLARATTGRRAEVLKAYAAALRIGGDVERGRLAFKQHCSVCHKLEGIGHELGPNLAAMRSRGAEAILANVIDPNAEVNPQYLNYVVVTVEGNTMTGMLTAESATTITLTRQEQATDTVLRVDIEQLQSTGVSLMPEGLEEKIDIQTMADIIAYIMRAG